MLIGPLFERALLQFLGRRLLLIRRRLSAHSPEERRTTGKIKANTPITRSEPKILSKGHQDPMVKTQELSLTVAALAEVAGSTAIASESTRLATVRMAQWLSLWPLARLSALERFKPAAPWRVG